jgi:hypothetical protein
MKPKYLVLGAVVALLGWFVFDSLSQPGVSDLPGNLQEVAAYRNENNTGPIVRIYAVTVADTLWHSMQQYGALMPYTKYGSTRVYFFRAPAFDAQFNPYCLAEYEKEPMGKVSFRRYPLR